MFTGFFFYFRPFSFIYYYHKLSSLVSFFFWCFIKLWVIKKDWSESDFLELTQIACRLPLLKIVKSTTFFERKKGKVIFNISMYLFDRQQVGLKKYSKKWRVFWRVSRLKKRKIVGLFIWPELFLMERNRKKVLWFLLLLHWKQSILKIFLFEQASFIKSKFKRFKKK